MKKKVKLTESQLTSLVKTTLTKVLNEDGDKPRIPVEMDRRFHHQPLPSKMDGNAKYMLSFEIRSLLFAVRDEIKHSNCDEELKDEIQSLIKKAIIHLEELRKS